MIDLSKTIDLSTNYLGLRLKNPLVASSSPMCEDVGNVRRIEDAGAAAVVLHSLFEEQITTENDELDRQIRNSDSISAESTSHFPDLLHRVMGPEQYLSHIAKCKHAVKIPIIASLNGSHHGRLAELRQTDGTSRRRCDRAEHLLHPGGSRRHQRAGGDSNMSTLSAPSSPR